jgi:hypothetical protein
MKTMAIGAGGRIWVSCEDGFAVDALCVTIIGMAVRAFLNHPDFIAFPWDHLVDVFVAVLTLNVIDEVGTRIMFCSFLFMASMAGDWLGINPCSSYLHMGFDIRNIPVTAIAGVGSVNGLSELSLTNFPMATETFGVIDTFSAIFPTFDDELFPFFPGFGRLGHHCGFGALLFRNRFCGPQKSKTKKETDSEDKKNKDGSFKLRFHRFPQKEKAIPPTPSSPSRGEGEGGVILSKFNVNSNFKDFK